MTKNLIIALLTVVTICSILFALYQTTEAEKQERLAIAAQKRAFMEKEFSDAVRIEAERQKQIAHECLRNKK